MNNSTLFSGNDDGDGDDGDDCENSNNDDDGDCNVTVTNQRTFCHQKWNFISLLQLQLFLATLQDCSSTSTVSLFHPFSPLFTPVSLFHHSLPFSPPFNQIWMSEPQLTERRFQRVPKSKESISLPENPKARPIQHHWECFFFKKSIKQLRNFL